MLSGDEFFEFIVLFVLLRGLSDGVSDFFFTISHDFFSLVGKLFFLIIFESLDLIFHLENQNIFAFILFLGLF